MTSSLGATFRPRVRLQSASDYRNVFRQGIRLDGRFFLLVAAATSRGFSRVGLAASRKIGGAVQRNRAKRLLREAFRRNPPPGSRGFDIILIPKREILETSLSQVEKEFLDRLRRLQARRRGAAPRPAPHD